MADGGVSVSQNNSRLHVKPVWNSKKDRRSDRLSVRPAGIQMIRRPSAMAQRRWRVNVSGLVTPSPVGVAILKDG